MKVIKVFLASVLLMFGVAAQAAPDLKSYCNTVGEAAKLMTEVLMTSPNVRSLDNARLTVLDSAIKQKTSKEIVLIYDLRLKHAMLLMQHYRSQLVAARTEADMGRLVAKYCVAEGKVW